ncbi:unnamed protein product [Strongylus vulgaris]|uniref:ABC transporter domain-containing protein n=1 Tax=Strongylus vulgaris TaxID=40348 RepID=A0A3P7KCD4_STRVU|nr:unnamed protein product [Strongylus vulgaris]
MKNGMRLFFVRLRTSELEMLKQEEKSRSYSITHILALREFCMHKLCYRLSLRDLAGETKDLVIESLNTASMSLIAFATYFPEYVRARLSAALLFQMLNDKPKIDCLSPLGRTTHESFSILRNKQQLQKLQGTIQFSNLFFSYPASRKNMVLKGVNINIPAGRTVAFVGPSGCGKSTSIQLIERFYDPSVGKLLFDDEDARELNLRHLRSHISLVGQEPTLFNYSIRENIAYGIENSTIEQIEEAAKLANAHDFITKLPEIVQEALERAKEGRTCIVIAHRLSSIQNADLIVVLRDGKVEEQGTHQQLLAKEGLYAGLVSKQDLK